MVIYLFIFLDDAGPPCPVFDCKIFLSVASLALSLATEHFSLWNPLHQSVSQSHSLSLSFFWAVFTFPDSSVPHHQLSEVTAHILGLQRGLAHWKRAAQHTHTHNLNPPCTPMLSFSLALAVTHTYIYTHTDLFAPVLIHKSICSSSLLVLRGHQWGYGDTLGGGARTRFTRYCLHTQPAARWKTDGRRHISWVFCCTEDSLECASERQQRAAVGHSCSERPTAAAQAWGFFTILWSFKMQRFFSYHPMAGVYMG